MGASRLPLTNIMHVEDATGERARIVNTAINRLRRTDGFDFLTRDEVEDTEVRHQNGRVYKVTLWVEQYLLGVGLYSR